MILAYHNIVPNGETVKGGDRSLHLPQLVFARQLDVLRETHDVLPLERLLRGEWNGRRPAAAVTFDDAYAGAVTAGLSELAARDLPATFFVAPGFVPRRTFWWDEYAEPAGPGVDPAWRTEMLDGERGDDSKIRARAEADGKMGEPVYASQRCASEGELRDAVGRAEVALASHSWSHANLARLEAREVEEELRRSLDWLRERFDTVLPVIAYPYGRSTKHVEEVAERVGYIGGVRIEAGWCRRQQLTESRYRLPRLNVPAGISERGFVIAAAGIRRS